jgi:hypothetical protein
MRERIELLEKACQLDDLTEQHRVGQIPRGIIRNYCVELGMKKGELIGAFVHDFRRKVLFGKRPTPPRETAEREE